MSNPRRAVIIVAIAAAAVGIVLLVRQTPFASSPRIATLSDRDAEIIEYVVRSDAHDAPDRVYFLTITPLDSWGEQGDWASLPAEFHAKIADVQPRYLPASEAYLRNHHVTYRGNAHADAWMKWITIKRWISDTKVEVEHGVWSGPLGGGASSAVYEKTNGQWQQTETNLGWVS